MAIKQKLTVIIPTYNVEDLIEDAIKSVRWADEILVVDSFSTDNTAEIARKMGARVILHEYIYSAKQKNWAIPKAKNNWILLLDSDEIVTSKLKNEILKLLKSGKINDYDGFEIARKHYFFGKFLRWGGRYPLHNVRLFKKSCRYEDRDVHAHIILGHDHMKKIKGDILHYSDRNIDQFMEKFNRYSTYQANYLMKMNERGMKINWKEFFFNFIYFKSVIKDIWFFIPAAPFMRFFYMYFFKLGLLDGKYGLIIALFYSLEDYVARTKYLEQCDVDTKSRIKFQDMILNKLFYQVS